MKTDQTQKPAYSQSKKSFEAKQQCIGETLRGTRCTQWTNGIEIIGQRLFLCPLHRKNYLNGKKHN